VSYAYLGVISHDDLFERFLKMSASYSVIKKEIDALKENRGRTRWLLDGFLSHEMFNLCFLSRNASHAEMLN